MHWWRPDTKKKILEAEQLKKKISFFFELTLWNFVCDVWTGHIYGINHYIWFWKPIGREKCPNLAKKTLNLFFWLFFIKMCMWMPITVLMRIIMSNIDFCHEVALLSAFFFGFSHLGQHFSLLPLLVTHMMI